MTRRRRGCGREPGSAAGWVCRDRRAAFEPGSGREATNARGGGDLRPACWAGEERGEIRVCR
jgi:hypothetical protein